MEAQLSMDKMIILKKIVEIINQLSDHITIICTIYGLEMNLITQDLVAIVSIRLKAESFFTLYRVKKEEEEEEEETATAVGIPLHVKVEELYKILKNALKLKNHWENMEIKLLSENNTFIDFNLLDKKGKKTSCFQMKLMDIQGQNFIDGQNPIDSEIFNYKAEVPADCFANICDVVNDFSKFVSISAYKNKLIFESVGEVVDLSKVCTKFKFKNPIPLPNKFQKNFSCDYLKKFSQLSTLSPIVTFGFSLGCNYSKDSPLNIHYSNSDQGLFIDFLLASQLEL